MKLDLRLSLALRKYTARMKETNASKILLVRLIEVFTMLFRLLGSRELSVSRILPLELISPDMSRFISKA